MPGMAGDHQHLSSMRPNLSVRLQADRKIGTQSKSSYFRKHYGLSAQSQCSESCWMMGFTLGYAFHRPHTTSSTSKVLLQRCLAATASSLASQFNHTIGIMKHTMGTRSTGHSSVMGPNTLKWWWYMHTTHVMWSLYWSIHSLMYTRGTPCVPTARQISTITSATTTAAVRMKTALHSVHMPRGSYALYNIAYETEWVYAVCVFCLWVLLFVVVPELNSSTACVIVNNQLPIQ